MRIEFCTNDEEIQSFIGWNFAGLDDVGEVGRKYRDAVVMSLEQSGFNCERAGGQRATFAGWNGDCLADFTCGGIKVFMFPEKNVPESLKTAVYAAHDAGRVAAETVVKDWLREELRHLESLSDDECDFRQDRIANLQREIREFEAAR